MTQQWSGPAWVVVTVLVVAVLALALALALLGRQRRLAHDVGSARAEVADLRLRLDEVERTLAATRRADPDAPGYLITAVGGTGGADEPLPAPVLTGPLFADQVLRETAVQAASLVHGVRRALAPETRNRIRFEMRREVKRARKQRRADLREARRDLQARQRSGTAA